MTEQSLYERIGGVNAIAMVVNRFSDEVVKNPKLNVNPALKEWNQSGKLPGLKFMRTLWLCQVAGGPFQYTGKDLHGKLQHSARPLGRQTVHCGHQVLTIRSIR